MFLDVQLVNVLVCENNCTFCCLVVFVDLDKRIQIQITDDNENIDDNNDDDDGGGNNKLVKIIIKCTKHFTLIINPFSAGQFLKIMYCFSFRLFSLQHAYTLPNLK